MNFDKTIRYERPLPVVAEQYDVIVCGGGPSGIAAALSAAREGLKVILIESCSVLGGMSTAGHVSHYLAGRTEEGEWTIGGLFRSLMEEAAEQGCAVIPHKKAGGIYQPYCWLPWFIHGIPVDPVKMAVFFDRKMAEAGVDVLLQSTAVDAVLEGPRITRLIAHNKSGLWAVSGRAFVDATGDADLAALSGCKFRVGRDEDNKTTPASLEFHVEGIDHQVLSDYIHEHKSPKLKGIIRDLKAQGKWPFKFEIFLSCKLVDEDTAFINTAGLYGINGIDGASVSQGFIDGRAQICLLMELFRAYFPGFKNARIKSVASLLGVRETRRITGADGFEFTKADAASGKEMFDNIGFSIYGWDLLDPVIPGHQPMVKQSEEGTFLSWEDRPAALALPYRAMVPQPVENLICPGRAISVDRDVLGALREMAVCMAMGEAAGIAAGQVCQGQNSYKNVNIAELRSRLKEYKCIIDRKDLPVVNPRRDP